MESDSSESVEDFLTLHELINRRADDWQVVKQAEDLNVLKKVTSDSPIAMMKARILIPNTSPDAVFEALWDERVRQSWDSVIKELKVIERLNENTEIIYLYVGSPIPWLVSSREFIQKRSYRKIDGNYELVFKSVIRNDIPVRNRLVRGHTIISGYNINKEGSGVSLDFISQNDIKGRIPPILINTFGPKKMLEWIKQLRKVCSNR